LLLFSKKHWFNTDDWSLQQDPTFWLYVFRFHFKFIPLCPFHFVDGFCCMLTSSLYVSCLSIKATYLSRHLRTVTVPGAYWPAWNFLHSPHNDISQDPGICIRPLLFFVQPSKYWTKYLCYVGDCSIEIMFTCKIVAHFIAYYCVKNFLWENVCWCTSRSKSSSSSSSQVKRKWCQVEHLPGALMSVMLRIMSAARWVFIGYICSQCSIYSAQSAVWERKAADCIQCNVVHLVETLLWAGMLQVWFLMVSLKFFIGIILPAALWPWGQLGL